MAFLQFLKSCDLGTPEHEQRFKSAGFNKVSDLLELVKDWQANPEKKALYNTLCKDMLSLTGVENLRLLAALKKRLAAPGAAPAAVELQAPLEAEDQKEATPTDDGAGKAAPDQGCIDLAFLLDTTGSMGSYIQSAQQNIRNIVQKVTADEEVTDVRFALVSYKDYNKGATEKLVSRWTPNGTTTGAPPATPAGPEATPAATEADAATASPGLLSSIGSLFGLGGSSKAPAKPKKKKARRSRSARGGFGGAYGGGGNGFADGTAARIYDFTSDVQRMQTFVDSQRATGGGDGPEAVATALDCCEGLSWRENAAKIAILIADAPPHGVEPSGDNFPDGDPGTRDALAIARALADKDITLYTVACEPSVTNSYTFCRDFMAGVAEIGGGMLVPLSSATLLTDMVLASCKEGADMEKIQGEVEAELKRLKAANPDADKDRLAQMCSANLASRGVTSYQVAETSNAYAAFDKCNTMMLAEEGATLTSLRGRMKRSAAPKDWSRGLESQKITSSRSAFSAEQCRRVMKKKARKSGWDY